MKSPDRNNHLLSSSAAASTALWLPKRIFWVNVCWNLINCPPTACFLCSVDTHNINTYIFRWPQHEWGREGERRKRNTIWIKHEVRKIKRQQERESNDDADDDGDGWKRERSGICTQKYVCEYWKIITHRHPPLGLSTHTQKAKFITRKSESLVAYDRWQMGYTTTVAQCEWSESTKSHKSIKFCVFCIRNFCSGSAQEK